MLQVFVKYLRNTNGKASKPNLAVVLLLFIIVVQAYFLYKAYLPTKKHFIKTTNKPLVKSSTPLLPSQFPVVEPTPTPLPQPAPQSHMGKIALIIDDSGYSRKDCTRLAAIHVPVTISIMPELPHSREIAQCAKDQGKEVMLHMPMEPHVFHEKYPAHYFIKTTMSSTQIVRRLNEALKSVPYVTGINNHEGSKATEDSRVMYIIFKELSKKNLFFVDSRVTSKSICKNLAEKLGLPFTGRDIFLDNVNERAAIEKEFAALAAKAKLRGTAVAIGHARELSWRVMTEQVKKLSEQGYEFVTVQSLTGSQGQ